MKHFGLDIAEGSEVTNLTAPTGTSFPSLENAGELFYRTDETKLYAYDGTAWQDISSSSSLTHFVDNGLVGEVYYDQGGGAEILVLSSSATGVDVTGTLDVTGDTTVEGNFTLYDGDNNGNSPAISMKLQDGSNFYWNNRSGELDFRYFNGIATYTELMKLRLAGLTMDSDGLETGRTVGWETMINATTVHKFQAGAVDVGANTAGFRFDYVSSPHTTHTETTIYEINSSGDLTWETGDATFDNAVNTGALTVTGDLLVSNTGDSTLTIQSSDGLGAALIGLKDDLANPRWTMTVDYGGTENFYIGQHNTTTGTLVATRILVSEAGAFLVRNESNTTVLIASSAGVVTFGGVAYPAADGTVDQVLATDGSGTLTWTTISSSPLTTKGDVYTYDTSDQRLAVGANGFVLTADSAEATGLKWAAASGSGLINFVDSGSPSIGEMLYDGTTTVLASTASGVDVNGTLTVLATTGSPIVEYFNVSDTGVVTFGGVAYPTTDGTADQVLSTDGAGTLTWTAPGGVWTSDGSDGAVISGTGDVVVHIEADTDNTNEDDSPMLKLTQDGGTITQHALKIDGSNRFVLENINTNTDGVFFQNDGGTTYEIGHEGNFETLRVVLETAGNVFTTTNTFQGTTNFPNSVSISSGVGILDLAASRFTDEWALDLNNSDVRGVNGIFHNDAANSVGEGFNWPLTGTSAYDAYDAADWMSVRAYLGDLLWWDGITEFKLGQHMYEGTTVRVDTTTTAGTVTINGDLTVSNTGVVTFGGVAYPAADGTVNQVLSTDGAGTLSWVTPAGASSPLTTKGDLYTYDTGDQRLAVGTNGYVLTADSAEATGLKWAAASGSGLINFVDVGSPSSGQMLYDGTTIVLESSASGLTVIGTLDVGNVSAATGVNLQYNSTTKLSTLTDGVIVYGTLEALNIDNATGVNLQYNGTTKLETTTDGITVAGTSTFQAVVMEEDPVTATLSKKIYFYDTDSSTNVSRIDIGSDEDGFVMRSYYDLGLIRDLFFVDYLGVIDFFHNTTESMSIGGDVDIHGTSRALNIASGDIVLGVNGSSGGESGIQFLSDTTSEKTFLGTNNDRFQIRGNATANTNGTLMVNIYNEGAVQLYHNGSQKFVTTAAGATVTGVLTAGTNAYPSTQGTDGQVLTTDGAGTLSWVTPAGGGSSLVNFVDSGSPSVGQMLYDGTTTVLESNATGITITGDIYLPGAAGEDALIKKTQSATRDLLFINAGTDANGTGSKGPGISMYGNSDASFPGMVAIFTGANDAGDAVFFISQSGKTTIGPASFGDIDNTSAEGGQLNINDASNVALHFENTIDARISTKTGLDIEFGIWSGSAFSAKVKMSSAGDWVPVTTNTHSLGTASLRWTDFHTDDATVGGTLTIEDEIRFEGAAGSNALIQKNATSLRDELQIYSSGDAYSAGSVGSGIHLYGNSDSQHPGQIALLTGTNDNGDNRLHIGQDGLIAIGNTIWDYIDDGDAVGQLNIKDAGAIPSLHFETSTDADVSITDGEVLTFGHWTTSFQPKLEMDASGNWAPSVDSTVSIGTASKAFTNVYTGDLTATGDAVIDGTLTVGDGTASPGIASIDFISDGLSATYDAQMNVTGGTATDGAGTVTFVADMLTLNKGGTDYTVFTQYDLYQGLFFLGQDGTVNAQHRLYSDVAGKYTTIQSNGATLEIRGGSSTGELMATFVDDGAVTLYHNAVSRINTTAAGVNITGELSCDNDLYIGGAAETAQQALWMANDNGGIVWFVDGTSGSYNLFQTSAAGAPEGNVINCTRNGGTTFYYNNNQCMETQPGGLHLGVNAVTNGLIRWQSSTTAKYMEQGMDSLGKMNWTDPNGKYALTLATDTMTMGRSGTAATKHIEFHTYDGATTASYDARISASGGTVDSTGLGVLTIAAGAGITATGNITSGGKITAEPAGVIPFLAERGDNNSATHVTMMLFQNSSSATVGSITSNNSATIYATSSDHRLKTEVLSIESAEAIAAIDALRPVSYKWKKHVEEEENPVTVWGFIAHEVQETYPQAVTGTKDEVFEYEGETFDVHQSMEYGGLTTVSIAGTKAVLEMVRQQQVTIDLLMERIAALENQ